MPQLDSIQTYIEAIADTKAKAILQALSKRLEFLESEVEAQRIRIEELEAK